MSPNKKQRDVLQRVEHSARQFAGIERNLKAMIIYAYQVGCTRARIVTAVYAGGWLLPRARSLVSEILCDEGHRQRAPGAGRKTGGHAKRIMNYTVAFMRGSRKDAVPVLLAAYRHLNNSVTK